MIAMPVPELFRNDLELDFASCTYWSCRALFIDQRENEQPSDLANAELKILQNVRASLRL